MKYFFTPQKLGVVILYHLQHFTFTLQTESLLLDYKMAGPRLVVKSRVVGNRGAWPQIYSLAGLSPCAARDDHFSSSITTDTPPHPPIGL
jgi:hypothetical protein